MSKELDEITRRVAAAAVAYNNAKELVGSLESQLHKAEPKVGLALVELCRISWELHELAEKEELSSYCSQHGKDVSEICGRCIQAIHERREREFNKK